MVAAVEMLIKRNIVANQPPAAAVTSNQFRNERLYNEEVDVCLKKNQNMLKALYSRCVRGWLGVRESLRSCSSLSSTHRCVRHKVLSSEHLLYTHVLDSDTFSCAVCLHC